MSEQNILQSIEDLDKLTSTKQEAKSKSVWPQILLSLVFPPFGLLAAIFMAIKAKKFHLFLPLATSIYSLIFGLFSGTALAKSYILKMVAEIGQIDDTPLYSAGSRIIPVLTIIVCTIGLAAGMIYRSKAIKEGWLSKANLIILSLIFASTLILGLIVITQSLSSLYTL